MISKQTPDDKQLSGKQGGLGTSQAGGSKKLVLGRMDSILVTFLLLWSDTMAAATLKKESIPPMLAYSFRAHQQFHLVLVNGENFASHKREHKVADTYLGSYEKPPGILS